jgi:CRISPR-associated protein Cas5 subtype I-A
MTFEILGVHLFLPLFSVRDPASWGVRLSFLLPPPRTLLGALARGVGILSGAASGEELRKREAVRNILTYAFEAYSYVTVQPLSPLIKSSQILRFVPPVEKGERIRTSQEAHDAFKTDFIFSSDMKVVFFINIASINEVLEEYGLPKINLNKLCYAARLIDRIGQTEIMCYTKNVEWLKIKETSSTVNTYLPYKWLERVEGDHFISELLPNLGVLKSLDRIQSMKISHIKDKELRRKKILYLFPLRLMKAPKGKEIFETIEVRTKLKTGYGAYLLSDGTKVAVPLLKGK